MDAAGVRARDEGTAWGALKICGSGGGERQAALQGARPIPVERCL